MWASCPQACITAYGLAAVGEPAGFGGGQGVQVGAEGQGRGRAGSAEDGHHPVQGATPGPVSDAHAGAVPISRRARVTKAPSRAPGS